MENIYGVLTTYAQIYNFFFCMDGKLVDSIDVGIIEMLWMPSIKNMNELLVQYNYRGTDMEPPSSEVLLKTLHDVCKHVMAIMFKFFLQLTIINTYELRECFLFLNVVFAA